MSRGNPTLADRIAGIAGCGDRVALRAFGREDRREWSYAQLAARIERASAALRRRGLGRGDRVVLLGMPSPEWIAACLAVIGSGGIAVPLDGQLPDELLDHVLADSAPRLVLAKADQHARVAALDHGSLAPLLDFASLLDAPGSQDAAQPPPATAPQPDEIAALFYTSGTTGPPKGVPLSHANLTFEVNSLLAAQLVTADDRVLLPLPLHHVYPFVVGLLAPLALGLTIVLPHSLTGPQVLRAIRDGAATVIVGVPRLYRALLSGIDATIAARGAVVRLGLRRAWALSGWLYRNWGLRWGRTLLAPLHHRFGPSVRLLACGGSALSPELADRLEGLGWQVGVGYGLTETSPLVTLKLPASRKLASVGRAVPGVQLRFDPAGEPGADIRMALAEPRRGELLVKGPNVFAGYRNLPAATASAFTPDGWFRTGDLASMDADGDVCIHGRASTLIVTEGGENVQPEVVEEAYAQHPAIRELGVLERDGQLVGLVVPDAVPGAAAPAEDRVREALREIGKGLPSYQRLARVAFTRESLPRTRLGKIQRHRLEALFEMAARGGAGGAPGPIPVAEMSTEDRAVLDDPSARAVWQLLAEQFPRERLSPDASPQLDLGVDSLKWLDLSLEIHRRVGVELDEAAIAHVETVRDLLQAVASRAAHGEPMSGEQLLSDPIRYLGEAQRRALETPGRLARAVAGLGYRANRAFLRHYLPLHVQSMARLPAGPFILAPNHLSYLDAPVIAAALDNRTLQRTWWAGWTGVMLSTPLLRLVSRLAHLVPIEPSRGAMSSLAFAAAALQLGRNLVWFPEGRRSPDGTLQPLKPGLGLLLVHYPLPVVPVLLRGTREALPGTGGWPRRRPVTVIFGAALDPAELAARGNGETPDARITEGIRAALEALATGR